MHCNVCAGVFTFLNGLVLTNNSIVTKDEIGSGNNHAILCYTNLHDCCRNIDNMMGGALGEWYDPMGEIVPKEFDALSIYRNRGLGVVRLHRVMNKILPSGIFKCEVNDRNGLLQSAYIGVYTESEG